MYPEGETPAHSHAPGLPQAVLPTVHTMSPDLQASSHMHQPAPEYLRSIGVHTVSDPDAAGRAMAAEQSREVARHQGHMTGAFQDPNWIGPQPHNAPHVHPNWEVPTGMAAGALGGLAFAPYTGAAGAGLGLLNEPPRRRAMAL
jgi:hypothetical protein